MAHHGESEVSGLTELGSLAVELPDGVDAAELHGLVCGLACGDRVGDMDTRLRTLFDLLGEEGLPGLNAPGDGLEITSPLTRFVAVAEEELGDPHWRFVPLLPDESEALTHRVRALIEWCSGFLSGFGAVADEEGLAEDATEALADLARVTELDTQVGEEETDEADYVHVVEHVKAAVLLLGGHSRDEHSPIDGPG